MKKIKSLLVLFVLCVSFLSSCNMCNCGRVTLRLQDESIKTYYLDQDETEELKKITLIVGDSSNEKKLTLNDDLVTVTNFSFDKVGEFKAIISYDNETIEMKYKVEVRKWDGKLDTKWYHETQKEFEIKNASELAGLASLVNNGNTFLDKKIVLKNDIDLNNIDWIPIGTAGKGVFDDLSKSFSGIFDGNNKTIYNLKIKATHNKEGEHIEQKSSYYHAGLFGYCKNATLMNVFLENVDILNGMGNNYERSMQGTGSLVGRLNGECKLENIVVKGLIKVSGEYKVGGIVGSISGPEIIVNSCKVIGDDNSYVMGTDALYKDTNNFGGIVGYVDTSKATFKTIVTKILVNGFTSGGVIGNITEGELFLEDVCVYGECINKEGSFVGGLIGGHFVKMNLLNCFMLGKVTHLEESNMYADIIISTYGGSKEEVTLKNVYFNQDNYDSKKVFNTFSAVAKSYSELVKLIPEGLKIK